jgi:hypothetical protein
MQMSFRKTNLSYSLKDNICMRRVSLAKSTQWSVFNKVGRVFEEQSRENDLTKADIFEKSQR